ncbi:hypothetical protein O7627_33390 [Solwaraspora sp. WMMD1047]|uniref:hypothetical protein n=1 Tax=Solwaraspora sp. WMMD1047 TaxID=3016102 RepID=UPI0024179EE1|nr:hypothetical protein [Solwaraspora sp. WMMD1047]MDG4834161.1 hypothetical protein [Solwaraspora sp. WMMD1047]
MTWVIVLAVGVIGVYLTDIAKGLLESGAGSPGELSERIIGNDPIAVVDVRRITPDGVFAPSGFAFSSSDPRAAESIASYDPDRGAQLTAAGAVDVQSSTWEVTLKGARTAGVEIVDMRPVLDEECKPPVSGVFEEIIQAGSDDKIVLVANLEDANPIFHSYTWQDGVGGPFFAEKKISLARDETAVLRVVAEAHKLHCRWRIAVDYISDGARQQMTISDPDGNPFEVTGKAVEYEWVYLSPLRGCAGAPKPLLVRGAIYTKMLSQDTVCPS